MQHFSLLHQTSLTITEIISLPIASSLPHYTSNLSHYYIKSPSLSSLPIAGYCSTSLQFSNARVDSTIISWNRMVLLHGPPGKYSKILQDSATFG